MADPISGVLGGGIGRTGFDTGAKPIPVLQDTKTVGGASFEDTLKQFVNHVSDQQDVSADYIGRFTRGEPVELHQVMAAAEEAVRFAAAANCTFQGMALLRDWWMSCSTCSSPQPWPL